jgi:cyd operon protein YbgT
VGADEFGASLTMWCAWVLRAGFACGCGILNAVWHEHFMPNEKLEKS